MLVSVVRNWKKVQQVRKQKPQFNRNKPGNNSTLITFHIQSGMEKNETPKKKLFYNYGNDFSSEKATKKKKTKLLNENFKEKYMCVCT